MSLHEVPWACMQFHEIVCSSFLCLSSSQEFRSACSEKNYDAQIIIPDQVVVVDLIVLDFSVGINFSSRVKFTLRSRMFFSMLYKWSESFISFLNPFFFSGILHTNNICVTQRASLNLLLLNIAQCSPPSKWKYLTKNSNLSKLIHPDYLARQDSKSGKVQALRTSI